MSAEVPEAVDAWRMVSGRRVFEGRLPLSGFKRLDSSLIDSDGDVAVALSFDHDALRIPYLELRIEAGLPLECQRSLQRFVLPVAIVQRLGLIRDEADEAGLPDGYEALLVPADGMIHPRELVEDELILAVPVMPVMPGSDTVEHEWVPDAQEQAQANPFAGLAALKKQNN